MAFNLPKQSISKGSASHKSLLKQRKSMLRQEEEATPTEEKRNLFENIFSREAAEERRAKRNPEGKTPHEIKLEKELKRMEGFGNASNFEIKAMQRRIGRAKADRLASQEQEAAPPQEEPKPTGYYTKGTQAYLDRFREGGDLSDRQKPTGWWDPNSPNYGGEIEGKPVGHTTSTSRPTGYWTKGDPNYMKGVETRNLAEMPFFSPERIAYYIARGWPLTDETVDPNFGEETPPPPPPPPPEKKKKKKKEFDYTPETPKNIYSKELRFPELGKWDYRNAPGYKGADPNYPLP